MKLIMPLLLISSFAVACPKGTVEFNGNCASMPSPEESTLAPMIPTSNEKPSRHPESAWERGEVHAETPPSCASTNDCSDQKAIDAAKAGKKAAGLRLPIGAGR